MTFPGKVEAAFGADRSADPLSWTWTDLTARTHEAAAAIRRGRPQAGVSEPEPAALDLLLDNGDGALTPRKATSIYYPNVARGLPVRHYLNTGSRYLQLTGAAAGRASTPDAASLDIVGDIYMAVQFRSPVRLPGLDAAGQGTRYQVFAKYNAGGDQRSYYLALRSDGAIDLIWSTAGTLATTLSAASTCGVPLPDAGPVSVAVHLDVNNGASGRTIRFWTIKGTLAELRAALIADETQVRLCNPVIQSGTTSIHSGTAPLEIGDITNTTEEPYRGMVEAAELRSGDWTGTVAANPDFTTQSVGAGSFADTAAVPKTWTINAPAAITDRKIRVLGEVGTNVPAWPGHGIDGTAEVSWEIAGVLRRMRQGDPPLASALTRTLTAPINAQDGVIAHWPHEDETDSLEIAASLPGVAPMTIRGDFSFASDSTLHASKPLLSIGSGQGAYMTAPIPLIPQVVGVNWQVTRFFRIDDPAVDPDLTRLLAVDTNGRVATWRIGINDAGVFISGRDIDGASVVSTSFVDDPRFFDTWAQIILEVTDDGVNVDWEVTLIPIPLGVGFGTSGTFVGDTGVPYRFRNGITGPPSGVSLGHLVVSTNRPIGWLAPADTAYMGEPAPQRAFRLCQEQQVPIVVDGPYTTDWAEAVAQGAEPMGPQLPLPLLDLLQECALADTGILGESRELLGLTFRSGVTLQNQAAQLTVTNEVVQPFTPTDDDEDFVNDVTVQREAGSSATLEADPPNDPGSVGRYEDSRTVNVEHDGQPPNHASWWLHEAGWPEMRYPDITVELAKNTGLVADWLDMNLGDKLRATGLPDEHPVDELEQLVDGYTEAISAHLWTIKANGRLAGPWEVGIRNDDTRGKRDTAGSTLSGPITTTGTTALVITGLGPLWSDAAAEDPFDIDIGGERITVTDVSGTTSPQTFTLTRSVNGVVKAHSAGAAVRLWRPTIRAF